MFLINLFFFLQNSILKHPSFDLFLRFLFFIIGHLNKIFVMFLIVIDRNPIDFENILVLYLITLLHSYINPIVGL